MYCPQCGIESPPEQRYCRYCGANLKVIGKAVALSEAIARSDRGPLPKLKEMMRSMKVEQTTDEISHALEQMNQEIVTDSLAIKPLSTRSLHKNEKGSPEQRRENHIVNGTASLFSGIALMVFLYYFTGALVLKIPPEDLARIPFEVEPVVRIAWLIGLLPSLSGLGRIIAGLLTRPAQVRGIEGDRQTQQFKVPGPAPEVARVSVTEGTTEMLEHKTMRHGE